MPNKMLIDASHPEETRVVVTRGNRIEEFDFESQDKKQLRGNIYLARVTRVEPSLQAAFVEYGGNRHGFLAFSEIHPDYYQIPVADRQALLRAEAEAAEHDEDEDGEGEERQDRGGRGRNRRRRGKNRTRGGEQRTASDDTNSAQTDDDASGDDVETQADVDRENSEGPVDLPPVTESESHNSSVEDLGDETSKVDDSDEQPGNSTTMSAAVDSDVISEPVDSETESRGSIEEVSARNGEENEVESVGAEDALEEVRNRRKPMRRHYKIQEVIKRRQILLVQVVKEERGNKGAALTTYLSLAGRYSVLMPNTARGGGISRKITSALDRKRLKDVMKELEVPQGMGVILRTAGENRTKAEIKRDYEYLMRLWENVRNLTLASTAPALVYEEGSLIKRSVRDLYNKDIDEILVAGEDGYREAKDFMRMLMPSHAKMVQPYRDTVPIFARSGIEAQLDRMVQPQVTLKSGGYIIINQTEALVSIDVNSGRSTREHSIEDTALQTNLEAADEVARQLRLRDLAGLIVIDFIDMEENRNNRAVEKKLKDCLKNDRARIQVGRISHFGLLEMSRQRIRASVLESTMKPCPHCGGTGHVRSDSSVALLVVRAIEEFLLKDPRHHITVKTPTTTALYVLNNKRGTLAELETRFGLTITIEADESVGSQHYVIFRGAVVENPVQIPETKALPPPEEEDEDIVEVADGEEEAAGGDQQDRDEGDGSRDRKRRKRRRRRGGRDREQPAAGEQSDQQVSAEGDEEAGDTEASESAPAQTAADGDRKKRRRGKRGGKRSHEDGATVDGEQAGGTETVETVEAEVTEIVAVEGEAQPEATEAEPKPVKKPARKPRRGSKAAQAAAEAEATFEPARVAFDASTPKPETANAKPETQGVAEAKPAEEVKRSNRRKPESEAPVTPKLSSTVAAEAPAAEAQPKKGWWQRKSFF
jgi:ribonuclease E